MLQGSPFATFGLLRSPCCFLLAGEHMPAKKRLGLDIPKARSAIGLFRGTLKRNSFLLLSFVCYHNCEYRWL